MAIQNLTDDLSRLIETESPERREGLDQLARPIQQAIHIAFGAAGDTGMRAKNFLHGIWLGHPLHQVLSDAPIGAWVTAAVLDLAGEERAADLAVGFGLLAAVPTAASGLADWSDTADESRRCGLIHGALNVGVVGLYTASLISRRAGNRRLGIALSSMGLTIGSVSAYVGGELVTRLGTGVNRTAFELRTEEFQVAARLQDLPDGRLSKGEITIEGSKIPLVLLRRGEEVLALGGTCTHLGGPLWEGEMHGDCVQCPWHGSQFDVRSGEVVSGPAKDPIRSYPAEEADGEVRITL